MTQSVFHFLSVSFSLFRVVQFFCQVFAVAGFVSLFQALRFLSCVMYKSLRASKSNYVKRLCLVVPLVSRP